MLESSVTDFCSCCGSAVPPQLCSATDEESDEKEDDDTVEWIQCDDCDLWYHTECLGLAIKPDTFSCKYCILAP